MRAILKYEYLKIELYIITGDFMTLFSYKKECPEIVIESVPHVRKISVSMSDFPTEETSGGAVKKLV